MTNTPQEIVEVIKNMEKSQKDIEKQIIDICMNMNGGVQWDSAWQLASTQRETIIKSINKVNQKMSGKEYL